jgi:hypothetical protein
VAPAVPDGCEFFRSCQDCTFQDCEASELLLTYGSRKAQELRAERQMRSKAQAIAMRRRGVPEALVAKDLAVSTRTIERWCQGVEGIKRGVGAGNRSRRLLKRLSHPEPGELSHPCHT